MCVLCDEYIYVYNYPSYILAVFSDYVVFNVDDLVCVQCLHAPPMTLSAFEGHFPLGY